MENINYNQIASTILNGFIVGKPERYIKKNNIDLEQVKKDYDGILETISGQPLYGDGTVPVAG